MTASMPSQVFDPARLAAVRATGLLDTPAEEPFDRLARLAATVLDTPLAFVTVVDERRSYWKSCIGIDATDPAERQNPVEESFCQYVVASAKPLIVDDATVDPQTRDNPSVSRMGVAAWAGFPLFSSRGEVLGTFCVVDTKPRAWTQRDVDVLSTLASAAAGEIALREAVAAAQRQAQATVEVGERFAALARTLQESLLPPLLPDVPGLQVAALYRPAGSGEQVLGDFYDVYEAGRNRWHVVVGDVCGHGIEAAKVTALARYTLRAAATREAVPSTILATLNAAMLAQRPDSERFLTAVYVSLQVRGGRWTATLCSAGHTAVLLRRADGRVRVVEEPGSLLGVFEQVDLHDVRLPLGPGDALVLYTDGVTEARRDGEQFGVGRLINLVAATSGDATQIASAVEDAAVTWSGEPTDDIAVLVLAAASA